MQGTFFATVSAMMVMFICMLVGFVLRKAKVLPDNASTPISKLVTFVLLPSLIINTFLRNCTVESIRGEYTLILYAIAGVTVNILLAFPFARMFKVKGYQHNIYLYAMMSANFGFLGNAVVPQILGEEALYPYMLFTMPLSFLCYAWWVNIMIPKDSHQVPWKRMLNPTCVSLVIGVVLGLSGAGKVMPEFLLTALSNLSGCMGPMAMLLTGFVIGGYKLSELFSNKKVYAASFVRCILLPGIVMVVLYLLGASQDVLVLALFAFGAALGLNTVVIPTAYGGDPKTGASMAMISHLGCIITIPVLYVLVMLLT